MGYRIDIEHGGCINCGICMDVCPVEALDMSRPLAPGIETGQGPAPADAVDDGASRPGRGCIGCQICVRECPVGVVTLASQAGPTVLAPRQGPVHRPPTTDVGWSALSEVTLESLKPTHPSPWGDLFQWATNERSAAGPRRAIADRGPPVSAGAMPDRLPGRHRRRTLRRARRPGPLRRRLCGRGGGQPLPVGLRLDLHGAVRGGLPARRPRRADLDPDDQAVRDGARHAASGRGPDGQARRVASRSSVADRPGCRPPTTWPGWATP